MFEGYGGPIRMDQAKLEGIDPCLEDCCRREEEGQRNKAALESTLRRHDRIAKLERMKRNVLNNLSFGSGCRCCYDPNIDGGEYPALVDARLSLAESKEENGSEEEKKELTYNNNESNHVISSDSDSDSEFDYLLDDDIPGEENLSHLQQDRMEELQLSATIRDLTLQHGYGTHRQMNPNRVLNAAGLGVDRSRYGSATVPSAVVLHLFDAYSAMSASLDLYLESLVMYKGTKFLRSNGRATLLGNLSLVKTVFPSLKVDSDIPALVAVKDGVVIAVSRKFSGFCNAQEETVEPRAVEEWLTNARVLMREVPLEIEDMCRIRPEEEALMENLREETTRAMKIEEVYQCGVPGCRKAFHHEHIGVKNERQSGLILPEEIVKPTESGLMLCQEITEPSTK